MREKRLRLVVTFHTTAEAIAMEKECNTDGIPGRLIPVPRQISAGCGLAWSAPAEDGARVKEFMAEKGLRFEAAGEYLI